MEREQVSELCNKRVAFLSLGCKVNSYETEGMRELFLAAGAVEVGFEEKADVYIVNTCSVTNIADRKSRQMLHRAKKHGDGAFVVAVGCYAQAAGDALLAEEVDLILGNNKKAEIVTLVEQLFAERELSEKKRVTDIAKERSFEELPIETVLEHTRAFIKIEDGCNQFCSYCIIPFVRGRVRSRGEKEILAEIQRLAAAGFHEVVLTGIHLSSYGLDQGQAAVWKNPAGKAMRHGSEFDAALAGEETVLPLLSLLKKVQEIDGITRIRLGSLEPRIMTEEFTRELAGISKLCPQFHLSLQSGCDATLKRMNRKYTTKEYEAAVQNLRKSLSNPAITTDIIVGFPGETEEEFEETLAFAEKIGFYRIHIFKYSRRKGTVADRMEGQIGEREKAARSDRLKEVEKCLEEKYCQSFFGREDELLVEEELTADGVTYVTGHTKHYMRLAAAGTIGEIPAGETICVRITGETVRDALLAERIDTKFDLNFLDK